MPTDDAEMLPAMCPKDGTALKERKPDGRFLVCPKCYYVFDSWLSREARYDRWDVAMWFLTRKPYAQFYGPKA